MNSWLCANTLRMCAIFSKFLSMPAETRPKHLAAVAHLNKSPSAPFSLRIDSAEPHFTNELLNRVTSAFSIRDVDTSAQDNGDALLIALTKSGELKSSFSSGRALRATNRPSRITSGL